MAKKYTDEEYQRILPKKQVGTAILFFNSKEELLVVKPNYKESWLVVGGTVDLGESPLHCAFREVKEEIGLAAASLKLVGVYHARGDNLHSDRLKFIFHGGTLSDDEISKIVLQTEELDELRFLSLDSARQILNKSMQISLDPCLSAYKQREVAFIESN